MIRTRVTEMLDIEHPIIQGGMMAVGLAGLAARGRPGGGGGGSFLGGGGCFVILGDWFGGGSWGIPLEVDGTGSLFGETVSEGSAS